MEPGLLREKYFGADDGHARGAFLYSSAPRALWPVQLIEVSAMIRSVLALVAFAGLIGTACAQSSDPGNDIIRPNATASAAAKTGSVIWTEVPSVRAQDARGLLDRVGLVSGSRPDSWNMVEIRKLLTDVTQQADSFRAAYRVAYGADSKKLDDDTLFKQVFEDKAHVDPKYLQAIVKEYETIESLIHRIEIARSIPKTGFATYRVMADRSADAGQVAEKLENHVLAYANDLAAPTHELRRLLTLDSATR
jgi:hypothetical protein